MEITINDVTLKSEALYPPKITAQALGLSEATLSTYRSRGQADGAGAAQLKFCKMGSKVYYRGSDLIAFIEAGMRELGADPDRSERARERMAKRLTKSSSASMPA